MSAPLRRPTFLLFALALGTLAGCSSLKTEPPALPATTGEGTVAATSEAKATHRVSDTAGQQASPSAIPRLVPDLEDAPERLLDQQLRVRFSETARRAGAPEEVPTLRAMVLIGRDRLSAVVTALGISVWRIDYTKDGLTERRHKLLDEHLDAPRFVRDLAFTVWPVASLEKRLPRTCRIGLRESLQEGARTEERRLVCDGETLMKAVTTTLPPARDASGEWTEHSRTTLENAAEGYRLEIDSRIE